MHDVIEYVICYDMIKSIKKISGHAPINQVGLQNLHITREGHFMIWTST